MKLSFIAFTASLLFFATSFEYSDTANEVENSKLLETPVRVSWEQIRSGELEKGQVVILEGFIGTLSDRDYSPTDLKFIPLLSRRNETSSFTVNTKIEYGENGNQMMALDNEYFNMGLRNGASRNEYYHTDIRIHTNTGGTAVVSTHVEITGIYDPGANPTESCTITTTNIEYLDDFDGAVFTEAIELTNEKVDEHNNESTYFVMDAVMTMSSMQEAGKYKVMIDVKPISNNRVTEIICHTGFWTGTYDDGSYDEYEDRELDYIYGVNGNVIQGDSVRLYGTLSADDSPKFRLEEVVRLSKSEYELSKVNVRDEHLNDEFIVGCINAINDEDGEALEIVFRDDMNIERAKILMTYWKPEQPWEMKDLFLAVMIDMDASVAGDLAEHMLGSPSHDQRRWAIAFLVNNSDLYDCSMEDVDAAIEEYKSR